jgi:hypothetical protein
MDSGEPHEVLHRNETNEMMHEKIAQATTLDDVNAIKSWIQTCARAHLETRSIYGATLLHVAVRYQRDEIVRCLYDRTLHDPGLWEHLASGTSLCPPAICMAAQVGSESTLRLLATTTNVNEQWALNGWTPLMLAAGQGDAGLLNYRMLKDDFKADTRIKSWGGQTVHEIFPSLAKLEPLKPINVRTGLVSPESTAKFSRSPSTPTNPADEINSSYNSSEGSESLPSPTSYLGLSNSTSPSQNTPTKVSLIHRMIPPSNLFSFNSFLTQPSKFGLSRSPSNSYPPNPLVHERDPLSHGFRMLGKSFPLSWRLKKAKSTVSPENSIAKPPPPV